MNVERLYLLRAVITELANRPPSATLGFDMNFWVSAPRAVYSENGSDPEVEVCGTTCCALGWAALDPRMHALGLTWARKPNQGSIKIIKTVAQLRQALWHDQECIVDLNQEFTGRYDTIGIGQRFFGLNDDQAEYIFLASRYNWSSSILPYRVLEHIDTVLGLSSYA